MHFARENVPAWEIEGIKFTILILDLDRLNLVFVFQIVFFFWRNQREINFSTDHHPLISKCESRIDISPSLLFIQIEKSISTLLFPSIIFITTTICIRSIEQSVARLKIIVRIDLF